MNATIVFLKRRDKVWRKDIIVMSKGELKRLEMVKKAMGGGISQVEAAEVLGISDRQIRRLVRRVKEEGGEGIIHKLRGRRSNRRFKVGFKEEVLGIYHRRYEGFGPTFAVEKLIENENKKVSDETLRLWLKEKGGCMWERKGRKQRRWRERKSHCGAMVQMDGSHHDWLEGRGPKLVLMGYIDDATGRVYSRFYDYEGTFPAMDSFRRYVRKYGIPQSVYADKHSTYKALGKLSMEDELEGKEAADTQFGRALKELGVSLIWAHSPQAKGRIERLFKTFQDRLVKELRLKGIKTLEDANRFLDGEYLCRFNRQFGVIAHQKADLHRGVPKGIKLGRIFCVKEKRILRNDFTVIYNNKLYQVYDKIKAENVEIEEYIDGNLCVYSKDKRLKVRQIESLPKRKKIAVAKRRRVEVTKASRQWIPPKNHPWRQYGRKLGSSYAY
jgi:transposase